MQIFRNWQILVMESMFQEISSACVHTFESGTVYNFELWVSSNYFFFPSLIDSVVVLAKSWNTYTHTHTYIEKNLLPLFLTCFDEAVLAQYFSSNTRAHTQKNGIGGVWRVEQLSDYEKHYMSKRTTTCNWLGVLELQQARCRKVCMPVNVMANSLTT